MALVTGKGDGEAIVEIVSHYYTGCSPLIWNISRMSFKDSLIGRFEKLADEVVPPMVSTWKEVQRRLDELNCSLAERSVPERRRSQVSELSLKQKAAEAGQGSAPDKPARRRKTPSGKSGG